MMSSYERIVYDILRDNGIYFIQEKSFQELKHGYYRFDFYIPSKQCIIEVQGAQHYEYINKFYKTREQFLKAKERDRIKISFCLSHNIPIYCIPYWEILNIHSPEDIFNSKFLATSKFWNDEVFHEYQKHRRS